MFLCHQPLYSEAATEALLQLRYPGKGSTMKTILVLQSRWTLRGLWEAHNSYQCPGSKQRPGKLQQQINETEIEPLPRQPNKAHKLQTASFTDRSSYPSHSPTRGTTSWIIQVWVSSPKGQEAKPTSSYNVFYSPGPEFFETRSQ